MRTSATSNDASGGRLGVVHNFSTPAYAKALVILSLGWELEVSICALVHLRQLKFLSTALCPIPQLVFFLVPCKFINNSDWYIDDSIFLLRL